MRCSGKFNEHTVCSMGRGHSGKCVGRSTKAPYAVIAWVTPPTERDERAVQRYKNAWKDRERGPSSGVDLRAVLVATAKAHGVEPSAISHMRRTRTLRESRARGAFAAAAEDLGATRHELAEFLVTDIATITSVIHRARRANWGSV